MKSKVFILFLLLISIVGCKAPKTMIEKESENNVAVLDSVNEKITKETKLLTTPQTTAKQTLTPKQLEDLPVGGKYQAKDGNATGTIEKKDDGSLEFTANCDSLTLLVESLTKEVYRLNKEKTELKTNLKEEKVVEVNKLSGFQWFQIYGFRIYVLLTFIFIIYKNIKNGKIKRLFQAISHLAGGV